MTQHFNDYESTAKEILAHVGKKIVMAVPLGLGKPIGLLNAFFRMASEDPTINLTIMTGLTLARPLYKNELEKRLIEPILDRLLKDYEDPLYEKARELQQLPNNIKVIEFFLMPGKFLNNAYVQQNYISSRYTTAARDAMSLGLNVFVQAVSVKDKHPGRYSLSCNSDLFHDVVQLLRESENEGNKIAITAEVNSKLPFMYGEVAEVEDSAFSNIVDTQEHRALFAVPREELSIEDHLIGLYSSVLIDDDGCLQIGIGKLSNALANALIFRHRENDVYQEVLNTLEISEKFSSLMPKLDSLTIFNKGLYASTEMLSDEYVELYKNGILKKKVYDHVGLQTLLNQEEISEKINPKMIDVLILNEIIKPQLSISDLNFLQKFGIFKQDIRFHENALILASGESILADLTNAAYKFSILDNCLGDTLKTGKIMHAGFFLGSVDLYDTLFNMSEEELRLVEMTSIARTNGLSWSPELLKLQRKKARFVNSSIMLTLLGGVVSDGLENYHELSGVGGQHDFVNMSGELSDARSIITCRSTRQTKNGVESNIVWDYGNSTLPRFLRDIVVTEYGIADCRSKTDSEVIKNMLNITDSRFQIDLMKKAKKAGKLESAYQIPKIFRHNYPEENQKLIQPIQKRGYCQPYPFGSDFTKEEQKLAQALLFLKNCSKLKLLGISLSAFLFNCDNAGFEACLERMKVKSPKNWRDYFYKKLLRYALYLNSLSA